MPLSSRLFSNRIARPNSSVVMVAVLGALAASLPTQLSAQSIGDRLRQKLKDKSDAVSDSLSDLVIDKATGAATCVATNTACIKKAFGAGKNVELVDAKGKPVSAADSAKAVTSAGGVPASLNASQAGPGGQAAQSTSSPSGDTLSPTQAFGEGVLLNYDFVPGDRVIFAEDFTHDKIGDFPKRIQLREGNFEVAEWQGQRFLRTNSGGKILVPLPEVLPSRFTFEGDYNGSDGWELTVNFQDPAQATGDIAAAQFSPGGGGVSGAGQSSNATIPDNARRPVTHVAVMADGKYAKVYVNGVRVGNAPNAEIGRGNVIEIDAVASDDSPAYLTNIRVAAGGKPLYDAIMADGRVATHGILFDTGSDRIRAESKPTLDMIAQMLKDHADMKLLIEGHTDNVGSAASNQTLSTKRAAAILQALTGTYHVDAARLSSVGMGATKPTASNDTPEGRQQNRRVELVKK